ncbi:MAG: transporter substrate-binding domain-containing protein, partial [Pseudomonadota bacterium]
RATTHDSYLSDNYGDLVTIKRYGTQDEAYLDLVAGRIDLILADSVAIDDGFLSTDDGKGFEFVGPSFSDPQWFGEGAGIAVRKSDQDLRDKLSAAIAAIRANGVYAEINNKYFDFDIYGD